MSDLLNDLIPVPRSIARSEGCFDLKGQSWRVHADVMAHPGSAWKLGGELKVSAQPLSGLAAHTVTVGTPQSAPEAPAREQGYVLCVEPGGVYLRGADADGLYWGLVTLEQMLERGGELPCCEISDWPVFSLRGHHDDISRKQVSRPADFCRIIRLLSRYKINVYTPYMEDMLFLNSYPDIGRGRGRLMPSEVKAMHEEAERHNVMIMPTYSLIGHQENLLAMPKYAHLGKEVFQSMSSLDPSKPAVRDFLRHVIRDVCELFPAPYFHAGFDETQGIGGEEFIAHANWCARELQKYGKQMPMWVDMFYNHFGCEKIRDLEENIIPVNWKYGSREGDIPHQHELSAQGRPVWGLAGYSNVGKFLPDPDVARDNIDAWVRTGLDTQTSALFSSQWGDNGYENHRDMCWNLFAYLGEAAWSGTDARRDDFEHRFQLSFYGADLPNLRQVTEELPGRLSLQPGEFWRYFRCNAYAAARWAAQNGGAGSDLERDENLLQEALQTVERVKQDALRQGEHLNHDRVALMRMLNVVRRLRVGLRFSAGMAGNELEELSAQVRRHTDQVRDAYMEDWLRNNKWPNIEVSLAVYEEILDSYEFLPDALAQQPHELDGYRMLDLADVLNENFLPVGGLPIGMRRYNGVPFLFAGVDRTHALLNDESPEVRIDFPPMGVSDLHLIISGHRTADEPHPAAGLELLRGDKPVHREELLDITHLCDWWAPLGEHIWAGGGMAYVDSGRVRYALKPGHNYGLAHLSGFALSRGLEADGLRIRALKGEEIRLFAATGELAE